MSTRSQDHLSSEEWKALSKNNMAKEIVIFPGGFHPIHPGHVSVYNALKKAFPAADVYIASSDSTKERPFPFDDKKVLATAAGIPTDKFVEVVSPYKAMEITKNYDPSKDLLIFGLSAKDANRLSYTKKDGTAGYFQKYVPGTVMDPFEQHAYVYIAPTVTFKLMGQAVSSASIIRKMYGEADDAAKHEILKELYPKGDPKKIKTIFDRALTTSESTMPPRYKAGLSDSTAKKRRVFWTKLGKYPYSKSEYEKAKHAPGDSKETTPSKYTTAYKNKFGEDLNENAALDKTLATKSKASGIPRGILRQVYNRGMAAWVTGHRPGASQQAWGMGRVNSFIVKGKTWHTTDSDLAKKVRSEQVDEAHVFNYTYWGWISPVGKLFLPDPKKNEGLHDHLIKNVTDGEIISAEKGMKVGWVRFFIELDDKSMHFETFNIDKVNFSKVTSKIKSIVNSHLNCSAFNFEWMANKYPKHIEEDDPTVFIKKVSNVLRINEHIEHSEKGWTLFSKKTHKRLGGPYSSKEQAIKRERQVAYFKHMGETNIKTFKQFSEEEDALDVTPKADQEVLLEVTAPKEVKDNVTDGLDLRSKFNRGGNSDTIKTANKLLKEPFDESDLKNLLVKLARHEKEKKTGWDDPEEPSNGFIAWMLLGGDAGKLWAEKSLSNSVKEDTIAEAPTYNVVRLKQCISSINRIIAEGDPNKIKSDDLDNFEELLLDISDQAK